MFNINAVATTANGGSLTTDNGMVIEWHDMFVDAFASTLTVLRFVCDSSVDLAAGTVTIAGMISDSQQHSWVSATPSNGTKTTFGVTTKEPFHSIGTIGGR